MGVGTGIHRGGYASPDASKAAPDPWATLRGCVPVVERFAACSPVTSFQAYRARWLAADAGGKKVPAKEIQRRLAALMSPNGRREQCAIWARRPGAAEHVGEGSALARAAAERDRTTCKGFASMLDADGWVPAPLIDARAD